MNKVAIAFLTKDRVELSRRTIEPLVNGQHALFWIDGSDTDEGRALPLEEGRPCTEIHQDVRGGADAAVAYALTTMLNHTAGYTHVALCENDVLLGENWFSRTMALFDIGKRDGLEVGAASPRAYEDRVLAQLNGYALCLNLGWGVQIMTRKAAQIALRHFRTGTTMEVRRLFVQLTGKDIGPHWAFKANEHNLVADWLNDKTLAAYGLASLALTPSPVEMIGQEPPLEQQGLKIATAEIEEAREHEPGIFDRFIERTRDIRAGLFQPGWNGVRYRSDEGLTTIFAHQVFGLEDAKYEGEWRLRNSQGFGPFAWQAGKEGFWDRSPAGDGSRPTGGLFPTFECYVSGACDLMVSGGPDGGEVEVQDLQSGYTCKPRLPAETQQGQVMHLMLPANVSYRKVRLTARTPGITFFGLRCREPQPERNWSFDHSCLPPV